MRHRGKALRLSVLVAALLVASLSASTSASAAPHTLIQGSGSSWSSNAVNQWIADVQPSGLQVVYSAVGSAQGRKDFAYKTTDYAVSDLGFLGKDKVTGEDDTSLGRAYAYLPVVAGGTSFPYQVRVGGQLVRNLRLSGLTLAKIFTNQITNWNDPAISRDNNGRRLPSLPIIPVVHSEGSGSSYQFTRYLDTQYPSLWRPFLGQSGGTEYFPRKGQAIAQSGSDGVMNYVASAAANGTIGYDEYSYAKFKKWPVAKLQNSAGYFTLPTQYNVAVGLTQAIINTDKSSPNYLLQDLHKVYAYGDPRTYAMSSYSYMIIPTGASDPRMTTAKRQTLADFLYYSLCQGQAEMGPIGYSPLPINLAAAAFDQTAKLKTADRNVDLNRRNISTCHNPTFVAGQPTRNYLAEIAPKPAACDKVGAGPCTGDEGSATGNPQNGKAPTTSGGTPRGSSGGTGSTGGTGAAGGGAGAGPGATPGAGQAPATAAPMDPTSGDAVGSAGGGGAAPANLIGVPTELAAARPASQTNLLAAMALALFLLVLVLPPLLARRVWQRKDGP